MSKAFIKICGLTDPGMALEAAHAGADFIGLVFHPASKRHVTRTQATLISSALAATQAKPVAVFKEHSATEMRTICEECHIQIVQLHGVRSRTEHSLLPQEIQRIYVQSLSSSETVPMNSEVLQCDPQRDYLLFDHARPGNGLCFDWKSFSYHGPFPWFLAGGLNIKNVAQAMQQLQSTGVDVSSGVESSPGTKDLNLIKKFIKEVNHHEK